MKLAVCGEPGIVLRTRRVLGFVCLLLTACCSLACSLPSLESLQCSEARDAVKQFYSFHFGNDMAPTSENLKKRERFLTAEYYKTLVAAGNSKTDVFTASESPPKTFKIAKCEALQQDKAMLQVQIYWRDNEKVTQKEVHVEAVKTGDAWLINKVSN